jgi:hypothetical protein
MQSRLRSHNDIIKLKLLDRLLTTGLSAEFSSSGCPSSVEVEFEDISILKLTKHREWGRGTRDGKVLAPLALHYTTAWASSSR